jgi:hypothetical protein
MLMWPHAEFNVQTAVREGPFGSRSTIARSPPDSPGTARGIRSSRSGWRTTGPQRR